MLRIYADNVVLPSSDDSVCIGPALVHVQHGQIVRVVEGSCDVVDRDVDGIIDLGSRLLAPAFVNGHTHLAMSAMRGLTGTALGGNVVEDLFFKVEERLSAADIRAFARLGALECLLAGTGAVFEHYYGGLELADALADVGLSGVVAFTLQDRAGPGREQWQGLLDATVQLASHDRLRAAGVVAALGPHATDTVSGSLWEAISDVSARHDLPLHVHVAQSFEEASRSWSKGESPMGAMLQHLDLDRVPRVLMVHGLYVSDADLDRLDPAKVVLGYCPSSQLLFEFPAHLDSWMERGIPVVLGTDAGACNDGMDVQRELSLFASGEAFGPSLGMAHQAFRGAPSLESASYLRVHRREAYQQWSHRSDAKSLLRSVWQVPGDFHPGLPVGRIAVGSRANLAAWDLDHPALWPGRDPLRGLAYGSIQGALHALWVNGSVIGEVGDVGALLRTDDCREMVQEASRRLEIVMQGV